MDLHLTHAGQKTIDVEANQFPPSRNKGQKVNKAKPIPLEVIIPTSRGQKVVDAKSRKFTMNTSRGQKIIGDKSYIKNVMNTSRG